MLKNTQKQPQQIIKTHNNTSSLITIFVESVSIRNKNTARQYHLRLILFAKFVEEKYQTTSIEINN